MKRITIDGKEYTFKFSVAASMYDECTKSILDGFVTGGKLESSAKNNDVETTIEEVLSSFANIPQKAITMFYAGLMEYHGDEIKSIKDARELISTYLEENKDDDGNWTISFYDVLSQMMEIMFEDNFFGLIGLGKMIDQSKPETEKKTRKKSKAGNNS
jgi:hypothetical protein